MLTRFIKIQLVLFAILTLIALVVLGCVLPAAAEPGGHRPVHAVRRPAARRAACTRTANVTYRGTTIGKVTAVEPTENGRQGDDEHRQQVQDPGRRRRQRALGVGDRRAVPRPGVDRQPRPVLQRGPDHHQEHGAQRGRSGAGRRQPGSRGAAEGEDRLAARPRRREAVGGLGPALQRLVDSTHGDRQRLQGQPRPRSTTSSRTRRRSSTARSNSGDAISQWAAQPERARRADRRAGSGAAQRSAAGRRRPPIS